MQPTEAPPFWSFTSSRAVQIFAGATIVSLALAALLGAAGLPFDRPAVATAKLGPNLVIQIVQIPVAFVIIAVAFFITRRRAAVDFASSPLAR